MKKLHKKIIIEVDSREKRPLLFPKTLTWRIPGYVDVTSFVETKVVKLNAGDYRLAAFPDCAVVERKAGLSELFGNLFTKDRRRSVAAFKKLADATRHPYLLLEGTPADYVRVAQKGIPNVGTIDPGAFWDALMFVVCCFKLNVLFAGNGRTASHRRLVGDLVLRLLVQHAYQETKES